MKQKRALSDSPMQMLQVVVLKREDGTLDNERQYAKDYLLTMTKLIYKEAFKQGAKLHDHAIAPPVFVIGTDKQTYVIHNLQSHYTDKYKAVYALRLIVKQFVIQGEVPQFYYHFTEVRAYVTKGPNDPFQKYAEKMGIPFPGAPMTTQYMVTQETSDNYDIDLYDIDNTTGELTSINNGISTDVYDESSAKHKEKPGDYGGLFTHIVYKPEDAIEIKANMDIIEMKDIKEENP